MTVDWEVDEGGEIEMNARAARVRAMQAALRKQDTLLDQALVGALLSSLFMVYEWLDRVAVRLDAEPQYDDQGGCYKSVRATVCDVGLVRGARPVMQIINEEAEALTEQDIPGVIEEALEDEWGEVHTVLQGEDGYGAIWIRADRQTVTQAKNTAGRVSGLAAFRALFPNGVAEAATMEDVAA